MLTQQGPGLPIIDEARDYERRLGLEREFTVVYWDQRGIGLSSRSKSELTPVHMVDDTVSMLELLRERIDRPIVVAGFSFGATFAAQADARSGSWRSSARPAPGGQAVLDPRPPDYSADQVSPAEPAQRFYDALTASSKELVWFESSAHTPQCDEPATFRDTVMAVRAELPAQG